MSVPDIKVTFSEGRATGDQSVSLPDGGEFTISASNFGFGLPASAPPGNAVQLTGQPIAFDPDGNSAFTMTSSSAGQLDLNAEKPSGAGQAYLFWIGIAQSGTTAWFPVLRADQRGDQDTIVVGDPP